MILSLMVQISYLMASVKVSVKVINSLIHIGHILFTLLQHLRIAFELYQTHSSHYVCHVALVPWADNVVLPCT